VSCLGGGGRSFGGGAAAFGVFAAKKSATGLKFFSERDREPPALCPFLFFEPIGRPVFSPMIDGRGKEDGTTIEKEMTDADANMDK
jgi:hypothetical protein